ncbi:MAG TPA: hypothetical protein VEF04_15345 [Blastocatellia bacterium]|nr:hypothetical protein [Blastocatellia bacterium]
MPRKNCFGSAIVVICLVTLISTFAPAIQAQTITVKKRRQLISGQRAIIFDDQLAALRTRPDLKAPLLQRLRYGRTVGLTGPVRTSPDGMKFFLVSVSRNTRGWLLADAVIRPRHRADAERLSKVIAETEDLYSRMRLARLCADEFRGMAVAQQALFALGEAAEQAAVPLTREAKRRVNGLVENASSTLSGRTYALNYSGLDRYNRIGVTFDYDEAQQRFVYDGAAYRELIRSYPRSANAQLAREKLAKLKQ